MAWAQSFLKSLEITQQSKILLESGHSTISLADLDASGDSPTHTSQCAAVRSALAFGHCIVCCIDGIVQRKISIDLQCRKTKVNAEVMARRWGNVALHPKPSDAIRAGTCDQWSEGEVPHWECQTLQCSTCTSYPVPTEEAREDAGAKQIMFRVCKYKVSLQKDSMECRQLKLIQKRAMIDESHCLYYLSSLRRGHYHMTSYKLAARCRCKRHAIMAGSISSHRNYGNGMGLSFNEEIQSGYYQNISVSVEGASLEWVEVHGK